MIVARWTGIPVSRLEENERDKLLRLDHILHERVIGQDEAVQAVTDAIVRSRAGIADPSRPVGSFIFLGPTGVGKTELARALTSTLFDTDENMIRLDMTEYQEQHTVSRLIGAPPGYVGYEEGGQLSEAVRRKPYSVVLFDEIEKAHPDVFNTLLQVLDDGRLTDGKGRTVDFRNTVLVMTSNIGSEYLLEGVSDSGEIKPDARELVMGELTRRFRPEFLNRLDDVVLFKALTLSEIERIVELMLNDLRQRLGERRLSLTVSPAARHLIAQQGFDPVYGARPLRRFIAHQVETQVARALLGADPIEGGEVRVDYGDDGLTVSIEAPDTKVAPGEFLRLDRGSVRHLRDEEPGALVRLRPTQVWELQVVASVDSRIRGRDVRRRGHRVKHPGAGRFLGALVRSVPNRESVARASGPRDGRPGQAGQDQCRRIAPGGRPIRGAGHPDPVGRVGREGTVSPDRCRSGTSVEDVAGGGADLASISADLASVRSAGVAARSDDVQLVGEDVNQVVQRVIARPERFNQRGDGDRRGHRVGQRRPGASAVRRRWGRIQPRKGGKQVGYQLNVRCERVNSG